MLGDTAVGKSSIVSQFMTSEYLHAYDTSIGESYNHCPFKCYLMESDFVKCFFLDIHCFCFFFSMELDISICRETREF